MESKARPATNLLRLELRAHNRALGRTRAPSVDFPAALATGRRPKNCRRRSALRPGGTPQEISRGQARPSGRGPRLRRRTHHAPAGHRRIFWQCRQCPPGSISATIPRLGPFSSMPRWGLEPPSTVSGAASAGADLPPANFLRRPSGTQTGRPRAHCRPPTIPPFVFTSFVSFVSFVVPPDLPILNPPPASRPRP